MIRIRLACALVVLAAVGWSGPGWAKPPTLSLPAISPDPRSEAMGGAPAPLALGPYAAWSNPGGLGLSTGFQAAAAGGKIASTDLGEERLEYRSFLLGWPPAGIRTPLRSLPLRFTVDYHDSRFEYGTPSSYQESHGGAVGLGLGRYVGIGAGVEWIHLHVQPYGYSAQGPEIGTGPSWSYGAVARLPLRVRRKGHGTGAGEVKDGRGYLVRVTPAAGISWTGRGNDIGTGTARSRSLPFRRRAGVGVDLDLFPVRGRSRSPLWRLVEGAPAVSIAAALGRQSGVTVPDSVAGFAGEPGAAGTGNRVGLELTVFRILSYRWGHFDLDDPDYSGDTHGFGISILGRVGLDRATLPRTRSGERPALWSGWIRIPLEKRG
jgi:hypothetical protein